MFISNKGIEALKQSEKFRAEPYKCPAGKLTIGYGHVISDDESFAAITENEAEEILRKDIEVAERCIWRAVRVPLSQDQFDSLVSFIFNVGCHAFLKSTLLKELNNGR